MARYCVLFHEVPPLSGRENHFDLMLEQSNHLATWELIEWPPGKKQCVSRLADHRIEYLNFEGELSNGRGKVRRVDEGKFVPATMETAIWVIKLTGGVVQGTLSLIRTGDDQRWEISFVPDTSS